MIPWNHTNRAVPEQMYGLHLRFPWRAGASQVQAPYIRVKTAIARAGWREPLVIQSPQFASPFALWECYHPATLHEKSATRAGAHVSAIKYRAISSTHRTIMGQNQRKQLVSTGGKQHDFNRDGFTVFGKRRFNRPRRPRIRPALGTMRNTTNSPRAVLTSFFHQMSAGTLSGVWDERHRARRRAGSQERRSQERLIRTHLVGLVMTYRRSLAFDAGQRDT